jgi:5-methylcytosine-specific restriction protein A
VSAGRGAEPHQHAQGNDRGAADAHPALSRAALRQPGNQTRRCDEHRKAQEAQEAQRSRARRTEARERNRMYARKRWAMTRKAKLFANPICELEHPGCLGIATEVHHKIAMEDGGAEYAMDNLVSACKPRHSRETRREQLERGRAA